MAIRGYFTTSNSAASFSIVASFAALVLLIRRYADRKAHPDQVRPSALPIVATITVLAGLFLTKSKGGILAFMAGLALFGALLVFRRPFSGTGGSCWPSLSRWFFC